MKRTGSGRNKWYVGQPGRVVWPSLLGKDATAELIVQAHADVEQERRKIDGNRPDKPQVPGQPSGSS